jgi:hypothetical protein
MVLNCFYVPVPCKSAPSLLVPPSLYMHDSLMGASRTQACSHAPRYVLRSWQDALAFSKWSAASYPMLECSETASIVDTARGSYAKPHLRRSTAVYAPGTSPCPVTARHYAVCTNPSTDLKRARIIGARSDGG